MRNGPLFHAKDRLAAEPVIDEQHAHLRMLDKGRNLAPVLHHIDQRRLGRQIVVPDVVMHELLIPLQFPGIGVQSHDAIGIKVVPGALAAVVIEACLGNRRKHQAVRHIDG